LRSTVPAPVASLTHGSIPFDEVLALQNRLLPNGRSDFGKLSSKPVLISRTIVGVPSAYDGPAVRTSQRKIGKARWASADKRPPGGWAAMGEPPGGWSGRVRAS